MKNKTKKKEERIKDRRRNTKIENNKPIKRKMDTEEMLRIPIEIITIVGKTKRKSNEHLLPLKANTHSNRIFVLIIRHFV